jgi:large subunit ribosomal protein L10
MPMARSKKEESVEWIGNVFDTHEVVVVVHNLGLTVSEISALRNDMREAGGGMKVVKNRLVKIAVKGKSGEKISDLFTGPTVLCYSEDPITAPKIVAEFAKQNDRLVLLGGVMGETPLDEKGVVALSKMPSREEVLSQIVGCLMAPGANIAGAITAPGANLASITKTLAEREDA